MGKRVRTNVRGRRSEAGGLHKKFLVMDRGAVETIVALLEESLNWQSRALKIIRKLRKRNGQKS